MQTQAESPRLRKAIRVAIQKVEESSGIAPDDPAMVESKHDVVRTVGELEVAKAKRQDKGKPQCVH